MGAATLVHPAGCQTINAWLHSFLTSHLYPSFPFTPLILGFFGPTVAMRFSRSNHRNGMESLPAMYMLFLFLLVLRKYTSAFINYRCSYLPTPQYHSLSSLSPCPIHRVQTHERPLVLSFKRWTKAPSIVLMVIHVSCLLLSYLL